MPGLAALSLLLFRVALRPTLAASNPGTHYYDAPNKTLKDASGSADTPGLV